MCLARLHTSSCHVTNPQIPCDVMNIISPHQWYALCFEFYRTDFWPFLHCLDKEGEDMTLKTGEKCAGETNLDWDKLNTCQSGKLGHE